MEGPHATRVAALLGDPARSSMLYALMGGKALTATELATVAAITWLEHLAPPCCSTACRKDGQSELMIHG